MIIMISDCNDYVKVPSTYSVDVQVDNIGFGEEQKDLASSDWFARISLRCTRTWTEGNWSKFNLFSSDGNATRATPRNTKGTTNEYQVKYQVVTSKHGGWEYCGLGMFSAGFSTGGVGPLV